MEPNSWHKSSHSNPSGNCLQAYWKKASGSNGNGGGNCVEAKKGDGSVMVRDTKLGDASPVLTVSERTWVEFLDFAKLGYRVIGTDGLIISESLEVPGGIFMQCSVDNENAPTLTFTGSEWDAFVAGARDGEFDLN